MRSGDDEMKWWIDLPKLTTLTTEGWISYTFLYPRSITLEGISVYSIITNRHALSHHCHSWQGKGFQIQENHSHEEFLSLLFLIPRHHSRSPTVPLLPSFFHTRFTINSLQMSHSHFISLSIITPHSSAIPNREMWGCAIPSLPFHLIHSPPQLYKSHNTHTLTSTKQESLIRSRNAHTPRKEHLQNCITQSHCIRQGSRAESGVVLFSFWF